MPLQANYREVAEMLEELTVYVKEHHHHISEHIDEHESDELLKLIEKSEAMIEKARL